MNYNTILPPFKWFVLENFPYIEDDFDALTNWQLFCKLGKEMNKIIAKCNLTGEQVENLTNAFNTLKAYVENYFENLDIQEEVDIKLDEMAESGELAELISQYLESQAIIGFNNNESLALAQNLANGSFARTYGKVTYNDGKGAFYKIRTRTNADVPDGDTLIALTNTENLVAEIIPYSRTYDIQTNLQNEIDEINANLEDQIICIGDSYATGDSWPNQFRDMIGYTTDNFFINAYGGTGFYATAEGNRNFLSLLQELDETITDKSKVKRIYVLGGYNDQVYTISQIANAMIDFIGYCAINYPNAKVYVGCVGYDDRITQSGTREALYTKARTAYKGAANHGGAYLYNSEYILHAPNMISNDHVHPSATGKTEIAKYLASEYYGIDYNDVNLLLASGKIDQTTYVCTNDEADLDSYIGIGKLVNNNVTTISVKAVTNYNNPINTTTSSYKIKLTDFLTIKNDKVNQAQFCTGSLNKVVTTRVASNGEFKILPAILDFDGINLNLLYYAPVNNITAIYIPYQEFELPSILC